ncbi:hypothetical protein CFOL_v3_03339, partial [Cephalotus follicularis]
MTKPNLASDSGGNTAYYTLFVDTTLDTHFALIVSDSDTVADLKKKIRYEHSLCFPDFKEIEIEALKVCYLALSCAIYKTVDLYRIMDPPAVEGVGRLLDGPPKRFSNVDDSSGLHVESNRHLKQKVIVDQFCSGNSNREALKEVEMEIDNTVDNCSKITLTNKSSVPELPVKNNLYSNAGRLKDNSRDGSLDVQSNRLMEGPTLTESGEKKKRRSRKKKEDAVPDHTLKENDASVCRSDEDVSQPENIVPKHSLGNSVRVVLHNMEVENKSSAEEPCGSSSSDINNSSRTGVEMINVPREETEATEAVGKHVNQESNKSVNDVVNVQSNKSLEESSHSRPSTKRKRNAEGLNGSENISMENIALVCGLCCSSVSEKTLGENGERPEMTNFDYSFGGKQRSTSATLDCFPTVPSKSGKRKSKKLLSDSLHQKFSAVSSSGEDVTGVRSGVTAGVNSMNLGGEPDASLAAGQSAGSALLFELNKKPADPRDIFLILVLTIFVDVYMNETDAGNVESINDTSELEAASAVSRVRVLKDHQAIDVEGHPSVVVQDLKNLKKDVSISNSRHENNILEDIEKFETDQTGSLQKEKEPSQKNDLKAAEVVTVSSLVDSNGIAESKNSLKKRRKRRKTQDPVGGEPVTTDHVEVSIAGKSSSVCHKAVKCDHLSDKAEKGDNTIYSTDGKNASKIGTVNSLPATDSETNDVIRNVLESLQQVGENLESAENMYKRSRKKKKKKRFSSEKNHPELQTNNEDTLHKDPKLSNDPMNEVDESPVTKKTESVKTTSMNKVNGPNVEPNKSTGGDVDPLHSQLNSGIDYSSQPLEPTLEGNYERGSSHYVNGNPSKSSRADEARGHMVNFHKYFVPSEHKHEAANSGEMLVDKVSKANESNNELKAKKNRKTLGVHAKNIINQNRRGNECHSHLDRNNAAGGQASVDNSAKVLNSSEQKKSLLAKVGTIFNEGTNESSEKEDSVDNADASTRTPSDDSLSSDNSDVDSVANFNFTQNGSHSSNEKEGGGKNVKKSNPSDLSLRLDAILRSSSRYKKAKQAASQLEDTESQPIESVPHSQ